MSETALRQQVVDTVRQMNALGINQGTSGNASVRHEDGMLITPSGLPYEAMTAADVVFVRLEDGEFRSHGGLKPSSEWRFHLDVYRARADAGGICHTHSLHATALACRGEGIPAFHYMVAAAGGADIRCAPYRTFGTQDLSDVALAALKDRRACLLANHGVIALGPTVGKAFGLAQEVEVLAQQYILSRQIGGPAILSAREMETVLERFRTYGQQPAGS